MKPKAVVWVCAAADRWNVWERWPGCFRAVYLQMVLLYGGERAWAMTKEWCAVVLLQAFGMGAGALFLSVGVDTSFQVAGLLVPLVVLVRYKSLKGQVKERQRQIVMELPELLCKLILLIHAGETLQQAIQRTAMDISTADPHPLRREWLRLTRSLKDHKPFVWAMEEFGRSCGTVEVSMFSTSVLMHFKRGGPDFAAALQDLSRTLWERRKAAARTMGEEAAAKLVFPMVLLFCTVMVIVAAPAILMMNG